MRNIKNTLRNLTVSTMFAFVVVCLSVGSVHAAAAYPSYTFKDYAFLSASGSIPSGDLTQKQAQDFTELQLSNDGPYASAANVGTSFTSSSDGVQFLVNDFSGRHNAKMVNIGNNVYETTYSYTTTNNEGTIYTTTFKGDLQGTVMLCEYVFDSYANDGHSHLESDFTATLKAI